MMMVEIYKTPDTVYPEVTLLPSGLKTRQDIADYISVKYKDIYTYNIIDYSSDI